VRSARPRNFVQLPWHPGCNSMSVMPHRPRQPPASYDEIQRRTVPEPDLGFKPTREEEALSRHRFGEPTEHRRRPLTIAERELLERVRAALEADGSLELSGVELDVDFRQVVLLGTVPGPATKVRIEELVATVDGVDAVDSQLVVQT
jgi:hypothetical protein